MTHSLIDWEEGDAFYPDWEDGGRPIQYEDENEAALIPVRVPVTEEGQVPVTEEGEVEIPASPATRQKAKLNTVAIESMRDLEDEVRRVERGRGKIPALERAQNKLENVMGGPSRPRTSVKAAIENAASAMYGVVTPERSARFRKGKEEFVRSVNAAPVKMLLTAMRNVTQSGVANFESEMAAAGGFADISDDMRSGTFEDDWEDATLPLYDHRKKVNSQFGINVPTQFGRLDVRRTPSQGKRVSPLL